MNENLYLLKQWSILETETEGAIMIYRGWHPSGETHINRPFIIHAQQTKYNDAAKTTNIML